MKIRILYQFFQGFEAPGHTLMLTFAQYLKDQGDDISVVSSDYGYMEPQHVRLPLWRRLFRRETIERIPVIRTFTYPYDHRSPRARSLSAMTFSISCLFGLLRGPRPQIIYASSPPLPPMFSAWLASRILRVPLILEVRDLWPASLVELDGFRHKTVVGTLAWLERFLYDKSAHIVTLTEGIRQSIVERGWPNEKVHFIGYGISPQRFFPDRAAGERIRNQEGWNGQHVVAYLGAHGLADNLEVVLRAAARLKHRPDIRFVLIGDGMVKERLVATAAESGLDNVMFHEPVRASDAPAYINAADLCIATLRGTPLFRGAVPSKLIEYMACGKAVIIGATGEAERIVKNADAGLVFDPDDERQLAESVVALIDDRERREAMGRNGCAYVGEHFAVTQHHVALYELMRAATLQNASGIAKQADPVQASKPD